MMPSGGSIPGETALNEGTRSPTARSVTIQQIAGVTSNVQPKTKIAIQTRGRLCSQLLIGRSKFGGETAGLQNEYTDRLRAVCMKDASFRVRTMTPEEVVLATDWAAAEGWNPGLNDARCFAAAAPDG